MKMTSICAALAVSASALVAFAQDNSATEKCFPADSVLKFVAKMDSLKPKRKDTLTTQMLAYFANADTRTVPMALYAQSGNDRHDFAITDKGEVTNFTDVITGFGDETQICGSTTEDGKIGLGIGSEVLFKNRSGRYSLAELEDGIDDGKSHYKKMLPGPMAMFVPKMTHILVEFDDDDTPAIITAEAGGTPISEVPTERFGKAYVLDVKALSGLGVDVLIVDGGAHTLSPVPSIKKMKSLGFGPDEDNSAPDEG